MNGWKAIEKSFSEIYPNQDNPIHYRSLIKFSLDGVSVYDGRDYWHFVTFSFTKLYEKETDYPEYSGFCIQLSCIIFIFYIIFIIL